MKRFATNDKGLLPETEDTYANVAFVKVMSGGEVRARLPLPVAGLLSTADADQVCRQLDEVSGAARTLGCELAEPFGTLSFLALPVIPELRITDQGLFDVQRQQFVVL